MQPTYMVNVATYAALALVRLELGFTWQLRAFGVATFFGSG